MTPHAFIDYIKSIEDYEIALLCAKECLKECLADICFLTSNLLDYNLCIIAFSKGIFILLHPYMYKYKTLCNNKQLNLLINTL